MDQSQQAKRRGVGQLELQRRIKLAHSAGVQQFDRKPIRLRSRLNIPYLRHGIWTDRIDEHRDLGSVRNKLALTHLRLVCLLGRLSGLYHREAPIILRLCLRCDGIGIRSRLHQERYRTAKAFPAVPADGARAGPSLGAARTTRRNDGQLATQSGSFSRCRLTPRPSG
jgi:hypothetical protein